MEKLRVVLDTNVLVNAMLVKSSPVPDAIYSALKEQKFLLVTSSVILQEVDDVLSRPKIVKRTKMTDEERLQFIKDLLDISISVQGDSEISVHSDDSNDDKFLVCAYESDADYLVSGDSDLLEIKNMGSCKIITPREFISVFETIMVE